MRARLALAAALLLALAAAAEPGGDGARYMPADAHRDARRTASWEGWFGGALRAMEEPAFAGAGALEPYERRFRMLVLPSFDNPVAVRIDRTFAGGAVGRRVRLNGSGGYGPGTIAEDRRFRLDANAADALFAAAESAGVARLPAEDLRAPICLDGTQYVFELVDSTGTRFVTRHQCELDESLRTLIRTVQRLTGLTLARDWL